MRRKRRQKINIHRLALLLTAVFLLLGSGYYFVSKFLAPPQVPGNQSGEQASGEEGEKVQLFERMNVLLMGVDTRGNEPVARADTLMLASVDPDKKRAVIISIPRDTRVMVPGVGWEKINATTVYGGPELAMKTVSKLLNVSVDYYAICDYQGFIDVIDTLGGVTINVERNMYHYEPEYNGAWTINLKKGRQRLDGRKALMYVRYRGYDLGDITRTQQQQKFLRALVDEVMQASTIAKLPKLVPQVLKCIDTNLKLGDMVKLARAAQSFSEYDIISQTLPGYFLEVDGISFWEVDSSVARTMVAKLYNGETIREVVEGTKIVETEVASNDEKESSSDGSQSGGEEYVEDPNIVITPDIPGDSISGGSAGSEDGSSQSDTSESGTAPGDAGSGNSGTAGTEANFETSSDGGGASDTGTGDQTGENGAGGSDTGGEGDNADETTITILKISGASFLV